MFRPTKANRPPPIFWSLPREYRLSLNISYVGNKVLQKVLCGRQYFYSRTNNYCRFFIRIPALASRWHLFCFLLRESAQVRHLARFVFAVFRFFGALIFLIPLVGFTCYKFWFPFKTPGLSCLYPGSPLGSISDFCLVLGRLGLPIYTSWELLMLLACVCPYGVL